MMILTRSDVVNVWATRDDQPDEIRQSSSIVITRLSSVKGVQLDESWN